MSKTGWIAGAATVVLVAAVFVSFTGEDNRVELSQGNVTTQPLDAASDAEGVANRIEQETSEVGDASNAVTDVAASAAVDGESPTTEAIVEESREIAQAEGVVGAEAFRAETYVAEIVKDELESSPLDETVKSQLAAQLETAEDGSEADLVVVLAEIRAALNVE